HPAQSRERRRRTQPETGGQLCLLGLARSPVEPNDHVGVVTLRADELRRISFPTLELGDDLLGRVPTLEDIALELPPVTKLLVRLEEHRDVDRIAHGAIREWQQPLDDDDLA